MAFLGNNGGARRPSALAPSRPAPTQALCPHCGKDVNKPPTRNMTQDADAKTLSQHYIDELEKASGLTSWEQEFVSSVTDQLKKRGSLSDKQVATLRRIYDEKC